MKKLLIILIATIATSTAYTATAKKYTGPGKKLSAAKNKEIWNKYCVGNPSSYETPEVNYENEAVLRAAKKLSTIADLSFYYYSGPLKAYGLKSGGGAGPASAPKGITNFAHNFLTILCGEFRDRATMVEAKINWILNLFKLPVGKQQEIDLSRNVWSQVSAESYAPYLNFSSQLWEARRDAEGGVFDLGGYSVDIPVEGQLVCETKFIFANYISKGKTFKNLDSYLKEYKSFSAKNSNCSEEDLNTYYDFRGDSNFKPNSPESNGMIWYSSSITNQCQTTGSKKEKAKITDQVCKDYFKSPFSSRWNAARAGLATWLFRDKKHDDVFATEGSSVFIIPHNNGSSKPFTFKIEGSKFNEFLPEWKLDLAWPSADIGFNGLFNIGKSSAIYSMAYERLRDAVNRHTDWYSSGFDDEMGMMREQAYSPFVASSYMMQASDGFTSPGATVNSPSDGRKHWMFVFKVKKENWYNTKKLADNEPIDFDRMWFDETSFGTNHLADSEKAWDRLGTALEDELDSILYLHNIKTHGAVDDDGLEDPNDL